MIIKADFHLHTCLSPCADDESTPRTVVSLAKMLGADAIAVSDHNCVLNYPAAKIVGEEVGITVIPAMELTTEEEIHMLLLFSDYKNALDFYNYIDERRMKYPNDVKIFGNQFVMNENDEVTENLPYFLTSATSLGVYDLPPLQKQFDFLAIPAHVDRESAGMIQILGEIPDDLGYNTVEVSANASEDFIVKHRLRERFYILRDSDAHYLDNMIEPKNALEVTENTPRAIIDALKSKRAKP